MHIPVLCCVLRLDLNEFKRSQYVSSWQTTTEQRAVLQLRRRVSLIWQSDYRNSHCRTQVLYTLEKANQVCKKDIEEKQCNFFQLSSIHTRTRATFVVYKWMYFPHHCIVIIHFNHNKRWLLDCFIKPSTQTHIIYQDQLIPCGSQCLLDYLKKMTMWANINYLYT